MDDIQAILSGELDHVGEKKLERKRSYFKPPNIVFELLFIILRLFIYTFFYEANHKVISLTKP